MRIVQNMFLLSSRKQWWTIAVNCAPQIVGFPSIQCHKEGVATAIISAVPIDYGMPPHEFGCAPQKALYEKYNDMIPIAMITPKTTTFTMFIPVFTFASSPRRCISRTMTVLKAFLIKSGAQRLPCFQSLNGIGSDSSQL